MYHAECFKFTFIQIIQAYTDWETKEKRKKKVRAGNKCDLETKTLFREEWRKVTGQARVHQDLCERGRGASAGTQTIFPTFWQELEH